MLYQGIKFRHLQCFLEVARLKSVGKAAHALSISQPAISKTLRELEQALGAELVERDGRGIRLTPVGEIFLAHAGSSITALRQGIDAVTQADGPGRETVRVGALPTFSASRLPAAVRAYKEAGGGATIRVVTGENNVLLSQLRLGDLDFVVGRMAEPDRMAGLTFEHLHAEPVGFFVRRGHPLPGAGPFRLDAILRYTILYPGPGAVIRPIVDRFLIASGIGALPDRIETVSTSFGRAYLRGSDAIWVFSRGVVEDDLKTGTLRELPVTTAPTAGSVGLTLRAGETASGEASRLMAAIRETTAIPPRA